MKADQDVVITTIYVVIDTICQKMLSTPPQKQKMTDAEIVTIAVCSALFFNSNHEKALVWLHISGYFPQVLSLSRFNRRVHRMKEFIEYCFESISEIFLSGDLYIEDSMPLPVCKRARASRNKKVRGREYCGYCVAKKEKFFGFRLHLIVDADGVPVSLAILPGADHDLTPLYEITSPLPQGATVIGDKAFNCQLVESELAEMGVFLMPKRRKNMKKQWSLFQERFILSCRHQIETSFRSRQEITYPFGLPFCSLAASLLNYRTKAMRIRRSLPGIKIAKPTDQVISCRLLSILSEVMGADRLKARTLDGLMIKTYSAVLALVFYLKADQCVA